MPVVAAVRLRYVPKDYWFDPADIEIQPGDHVVVDTERGKEMGLCIATGLEVDESDLKAPLKPVLRVATEDDFARIDQLSGKTDQAMRRFRELVSEHDLDMKPVEVEFMFDGNHATFYFTAEDRVDFRSLVRDLASEFHIRVDMRQIGVRDEARALGGLGHCGQELCCARMGGEFQPVSIRMAKEQDLPLNPAKISGLCGRLMCCLRYEFEAYKDFKGRAPKRNALIDTPLGTAKVVEFDTPRETVRVRFEDGKSMQIPVSSMDTGDKEPRPGERMRPCHISQEAFDKIIEDLNHDNNLAMMGDKLFSDDPDLADTTARAGSVERTQRRRSRGASAGKGEDGARRESSSRRRRSRSRDMEEAAPRTERKRRRSVAVGDANGERPAGQRASSPSSRRETASGDAREGSSGNRSRRRRSRGHGHSSSSGSTAASQGTTSAGSSHHSRPRPGQHSSTVSGTPGASQGTAQAHQGFGNGDSAAPRKRRRRGKRGGRGRNGGSSNAGASTSADAGSNDTK